MTIYVIWDVDRQDKETVNNQLGASICSQGPASQAQTSQSFKSPFIQEFLSHL